MPKRFSIIFAAFIAALTTLANINIWEEDPRHQKVEMIPYLAGGSTDAAVIVCPGGSYFWHDMSIEGHDVAKWLQQNGITAFVLKYRAGGMWAFLSHYRLLWRGIRYPDAQNDLLQALRYVRQHAQEFGINADEVGAMGFSAGGHLVMSAASFNAHDYLKAYGIDAEVSLRPDFVCPIYPVVTMTESCVHKRSRRALLSEKHQNDPVMRDSLSLERHIPDNCPPVFIVNCVDDPIVDYHNSMLLDSALTVNKVEHRYIQYQTGGHGFGASEEKGTAECHQWKKEFLNWIRSLSL